MRKIYILLSLALSFFPRQNCSNKIREKNLMGNPTVLDVAIKRRFDSGMALLLQYTRNKEVEYNSVCHRI